MIMPVGRGKKEIDYLMNLRTDVSMKRYVSGVSFLNH